MAKTRISVSEVENLYSGRTGPSRKGWLGNQGKDLQAPQFAEDRHGRAYSNGTPRSWVHGGNATSRPGFDASPARGKERR